LEPSSSSLKNCEPYKSYNNSEDPEDVYLPCGLIARSMFTGKLAEQGGKNF
jgi:hypothetical protein